MVGIAQYLLIQNVRRYDSRFYRAAGLSVNQRRGVTAIHIFSSSLTPFDYRVDIQQSISRATGPPNRTEN
jgi:hypothetical protein